MVDRLGGGVDAVLLFYGVLGDPRTRDMREARKILITNFLSAAEWCLMAAEVLERQDSGVFWPLYQRF